MQEIIFSPTPPFAVILISKGSPTLTFEVSISTSRVSLSAGSLPFSFTGTDTDTHELLPAASYAVALISYVPIAAFLITNLSFSSADISSPFTVTTVFVTPILSSAFTVMIMSSPS